MRPAGARREQRPTYKVNIRVSQEAYDELCRRSMNTDVSVRVIAGTIVTEACARPRRDRPEPQHPSVPGS